MDVQLKDEIEALRKLKTKALKARYFELFGEVSPSSNHTHIFRRLAWRLQARAQGGLSDRARQRAVALADDADIRLRAPKWFWGELEGSTESNRDLRLPPPGTVLNRMHQGHNIEVKIIGEGGAAFEYNGKTYQSLSAIAHKVTGTRWNGFAFFGLKGPANNV